MDWIENYCPVCARTLEPAPPTPPTTPAPALAPIRPAAKTIEIDQKFPIEFPYNANWRIALVFTILFVGCAGGSAYSAITNHAGVIINGAITLGPVGATRFYWGFAIVMAFLALFCGVAFVSSFLWPGVLVLQADALLLPTGLRKTRIIHIPYGQILECQETEIGKQRHKALRVILRSKEYSVHATALPNPEAYAFVRKFLRSRCRRS
ncbi:MAG TPA: hypothetical protein VMH30_13990 [Verrucomicrobiae bacterium]|nr:hypothetical protein [Verrucomicrobiae bacterium]